MVFSCRGAVVSVLLIKLLNSSIFSGIGCDKISVTPPLLNTITQKGGGGGGGGSR